MQAAISGADTGGQTGVTPTHWSGGAVKRASLAGVRNVGRLLFWRKCDVGLAARWMCVTIFM